MGIARTLVQHDGAHTCHLLYAPTAIFHPPPTAPDNCGLLALASSLLASKMPPHSVTRTRCPLALGFTVTPVFCFGVLPQARHKQGQQALLCGVLRCRGRCHRRRRATVGASPYAAAAEARAPFRGESRAAAGSARSLSPRCTLCTLPYSHRTYDLTSKTELTSLLLHEFSECCDNQPTSLAGCEASITKNTQALYLLWPPFENSLYLSVSGPSFARCSIRWSPSVGILQCWPSSRVRGRCANACPSCTSCTSCTCCTCCTCCSSCSPDAATSSYSGPSITSSSGSIVTVTVS